MDLKWYCLFLFSIVFLATLSDLVKAGYVKPNGKNATHTISKESRIYIDLDGKEVEVVIPKGAKVNVWVPHNKPKVEEGEVEDPVEATDIYGMDCMVARDHEVYCGAEAKHFEQEPTTVTGALR
jgi:hypothetical protein